MRTVITQLDLVDARPAKTQIIHAVLSFFQCRNNSGCVDRFSLRHEIFGMSTRFEWSQEFTRSSYMYPRQFVDQFKSSDRRTVNLFKNDLEYLPILRHDQ